MGIHRFLHFMVLTLCGITLVHVQAGPIGCPQTTRPDCSEENPGQICDTPQRYDSSGCTYYTCENCVSVTGPDPGSDLPSGPGIGPGPEPELPSGPGIGPGPGTDLPSGPTCPTVDCSLRNTDQQTCVKQNVRVEYGCEIYECECQRTCPTLKIRDCCLMNTDQQTCTGKEEEVNGCPTYKCECFDILGIEKVKQLAGEITPYVSIAALDFASPCNGIMETFTFFRQVNQPRNAYLLILEPSRFAAKFKVRAKLTIESGPIGEQTIHIGKEIKSGDVLGVSKQGQHFISSELCESTDENKNGCSKLADLLGARYDKVEVGNSYRRRYIDKSYRLSMNAKIACEERRPVH